MVSFLRFTMSIAICVLSHSAAVANVKVYVAYSTYEVHGLTFPEIDADIAKQAPNYGDGTSDGDTEATYELNVQLLQTGNYCRVGTDEVLLKLRIVLPSWNDAARATPAVRKAWNEYFQQIKAHEERHKEVSIQSARKLYRLIHRRVAAGSCAELKTTLNKALDDILAGQEGAQGEIDVDN